ncbi:hypothetical protein [Chitinophaga sp. MM2321]|uniref:hypothetical protein n=1 Tax=Chitinophaga sp. MM2321 TaxID=3137178 RepID=UPI0032D58D06
MKKILKQCTPFLLLFTSLFFPKNSKAAPVDTKNDITARINKVRDMVKKQAPDMHTKEMKGEDLFGGGVDPWNNWGNWGNWANWNNWNNWAKWDNWANWGNWGNY